MKKVPLLQQGRKRAYPGEYWVVERDGDATICFIGETGFLLIGTAEIIPWKAWSDRAFLVRRIDTTLPKKGNSRGK